MIVKVKLKVSTSLNKSLQLFLIFLAKYKEMMDGSRLLPSTDHAHLIWEIRQKNGKTESYTMWQDWNLVALLFPATRGEPNTI